MKKEKQTFKVMASVIVILIIALVGGAIYILGFTKDDSGDSSDTTGTEASTNNSGNSRFPQMGDDSFPGGSGEMPSGGPSDMGGMGMGGGGMESGVNVFSMLGDDAEQALENQDYDAWQDAVSDDTRIQSALNIEDEDDFLTLVQAYQYISEAEEILEDLE